MRSPKHTEEAKLLFTQGVQVLTDIQCNGICIDTGLVNRSICKWERRCVKAIARIHSQAEMKVWKNMYPYKVNVQSTVQLGAVLGKLGLLTEKTEKGQWKTDEKTLSELPHPLVKSILELRKKLSLLAKLKTIAREVVNGKIHPSFNLHLVQTYRSSSDSPNFQNLPIREPMLGKAIRSLFIPREGHRLVEVDYSQIEVRVAACYHKDPVMLEYCRDTTKDMHRDMAVDCYCLSGPGEVTKDVRYCAKNGFVFPQFYGDSYPNCARSMWESIDKKGLMTASGLPMKDHLRSRGIKTLGLCSYDEKPRKGTFEKHIAEVEQRFWHDRFVVYDAWKAKWYQKYLRRGWLRMLTGFVCSGFMKRNEVINYPVQGAAFHCLLFALVQLRRELKRRKMKSLLVGQIHDSVLADVPENEFDQFKELAQEVMVEMLCNAWSWIIVPIMIEVEASGVNQPWSKKEKDK